ncbi:MAG: DNRLRE domain-containing protein [Myxococcales bacterium]|nr:DNRLRE domain-containing protein [Myxococcales bacterium]
MQGQATHPVIATRVTRWGARAALASAALTLSCASGPRPCVSTACGTGYECLANTCVRAGGEPVAPQTERVALEPSRWQVLSQGRQPEAGAVAVHFGGRADDVYLLDFDLPALEADAVSRAFLLLFPLPDAAQGTNDASVSAWRLVEPWNDRVDYIHQPKAARPSSDGIARSPLPLRVDVTALVRRWLANQGTTHGIVLRSSSGAGQPQVYATGFGAGRAPLLEVYFAAPRAAEASGR